MADVIDDPTPKIIAGYQQLAPRWEAFADTAWPPLREQHTEWLDRQLGPRSKVLELGCGTGRPVAELLARRHDYLGIDISPEMVTVASANVPSGEFMVGDMRQVELPTAEFAAVMAFHSIIHLPREDHPEMFHRIRRWLQPDGLAVVCLSSRDQPAEWDENWLEAGSMFWSGYDPETNLRMVTDARFNIIDAKVIPQLEGGEKTAFHWIKARATSGR